MRHFDTRRVLLAVSFGALGLGGAIIVASLLGVLQQTIGITLVTVTPLTAGLLGFLLAPYVQRGWVWKTILFGWLAGIVNGMLVGAIAMHGDMLGSAVGLYFGAIYGTVCGACYVPALLYVVFHSRRVGQSRLGSISDGIDRRAVWTATAGALLLALFGLGRDLHLHAHQAVFLRLVEAGLAVVMAVLVADLIALGRLVWLRDRLLGQVPQAGVAGFLRAPGFVDVGIGESGWTAAAQSGGPYRTEEERRLIALGDVPGALRRITRSLVVDVGVLAIGLCAALRLLCR
jgi:hypothetical protein